MYVRPRFPPKTKPNKDELAYRLWGDAHQHCAACGRGWGRAFYECWPGLENHHIVKAGRSHDPCNLLRLCRGCHNLAEGLDVRDPASGLLLPKLTIGMCLTLKLLGDPDEYDAERLQLLRGSRLPEPEPLPTYFLRMRGAAE